jgi:hypothetical protein
VAPTELFRDEKTTADADFIINVVNEVNLSMMADCSQLITSVTEQLLQMLNPPLVGVPLGTKKQQQMLISQKVSNYP